MGVKLETYLKWATCFAPLLFTMDDSMRSFEVSIFILACIGVFYSKVTARRSVNVPEIKCVVGICVLSFLFNSMNMISFGSLIMVVFGVLTIDLIAVCCDRDFDLSIPLFVSVAMGWVSFLIQKYIGFTFIVNTVEPGGILGNAPQLALLTSIAIPFAYKKNELFGLLLALLCLWVGEITGIIALVVTMLTFGDIWVVFPCILGVFFLKNHIFQAFSIRFPVWDATLLQIAKRPLLGYGPGVFDSVSSQFILGYYHASNAFSSLMQAVFGCGIVILLPIYRFFERVFKFRKNIPEKAVILVLFALSFVEYPFEVVRFWFLYVVIIGVFLAKQTEVKNAS